MGCEMYNPRITFPRALSASSASPQIQAASVSMGDSRLRLEDNPSFGRFDVLFSGGPADMLLYVSVLRPPTSEWV